ncbi:MAG: isochorismatase family cysteine hydrolase [Pseudomonadota bacterium]
MPKMDVNVWFRKALHPDYPKETTSLRLEKDKSALIIVDMQNMFVHPKGTFGSRGIDVSGAGRLVKPISDMAGAFRIKHRPVIYARHTFRPNFPDRSRMYVELMYARQGKEPTGILLRDSWESAIVDELTPLPDDILIDAKHLFSCFHQTDMEMVLRNLGIENLFFTGVTTSICVETSIRDAFHRDFRCILVDDGTWEKVPEMGAASKKVIAMHFGYLTSSQDVLRALT